MSSTDNILQQLANLEKRLEAIQKNWESQPKAGKKPDNASKQAHSHQDKGTPSSERKKTGEHPCKNSEPIKLPSTPTTEPEDEGKMDPNPTMSFPAGSLREIVETMRRKTNPLKEGISITTKPVYMGKGLEDWIDQANDNWLEEEQGSDKSIA
ncbi:hypothetical protein FRC11_002743 [Ceratobasidium sp. 423]|nr:hypothetical protein FRC11_002743 [Ceratobasidium sp. 423]